MNPSTQPESPVRFTKKVTVVSRVKAQDLRNASAPRMVKEFNEEGLRADVMLRIVLSVANCLLMADVADWGRAILRLAEEARRRQPDL
jgi:hypothetical protein